MALVEIPDELLASVAALASTEFRTPEAQVAYLAQEGLRRLEEKKADAERKRRARELVRGQSGDSPGHVRGRPPAPFPFLPTPI